MMVDVANIHEGPVLEQRNERWPKATFEPNQRFMCHEELNGDEGRVLVRVRCTSSCLMMGQSG